MCPFRTACKTSATRENPPGITHASQRRGKSVSDGFSRASLRVFAVKHTGSPARSARWEQGTVASVANETLNRGVAAFWVTQKCSKIHLGCCYGTDVVIFYLK